MRMFCLAADDCGLRALRRHPVGRLALLLLVALLNLALPDAASALEPIVVSQDQDRIEITLLGKLYESRGDSLQVETASGADGSVSRMSVAAATPGTNPSWLVFALTNPSEKPVERWITAERYTIVGSGAVWPDLDARRIEAVTPSLGFVPERVKSDRADVFRVTLEPGQTITYVAELAAAKYARVFLWKPIDYELKTRDRLMFNGIMLGLTGLLAIFLTAIFAANHKLVFPASALVAWCALVYLSVDFGFFHKLFQLRAEDSAVYRAAAESALAASLVIFLYVYLRLALWLGVVRMLVSVWILAQLALIAIAVIDPRLAATFARLSFVLTGIVGGMFVLYLAVRGQDRALSLIPTWILFLVWIFAAAMILTERLHGDMVVSGLVAGFVLILLIIGYTVTQFAFRSIEPVYGAAPSEAQRRAAAVDGANAAVWEWNARRDEITVGGTMEQALGLSPGELSAKTDEFARHMHPTDRERFRLILFSLQERGGGRLHTDLRMRHADNTYRWFEIEAATVPGADPRNMRCVGLVRDVTDARRAHERLVHDAVHCSLTGLPNRELLLDRLNVAIQRAKSEGSIRPALIVVGIDKFKSVNSSFGLVVGDSLLLTVARRLQRHLGPNDTLARLGGDQFAILTLDEQTPTDYASLAERIRRSLRSPIKIAGQEIVLTGSLGVAIWDDRTESNLDLLKVAEIALYRAKRAGADRIEIFKPEMRSERDDRVVIESELRKALEKGQIKVFYQPIISLATEELAGFEALVRWEHPKQGLVNPSAFVPVAEESDLIVKLGSHVLLTAARDAAQWQKELPRAESPLFVSVNISSRQLFRQDLIQEIRHILGRNLVPKGALKLEVTESLVMENPEQASEILEWLRGAGADLALDDFGTGYSSLAYLQRFPFDIIKIDKALIQASGGRDAASSVIVRSMVAMAHELGKKVVAEGIESAEDAGFLRGIGCEFAQGYYYAGAIPDREVLQLLKAIRKSEMKLQPRSFFRTRGSKKQQQSKPGKSGPSDGPPQPNGANGQQHPQGQPPPFNTGAAEPNIDAGSHPGDPMGLAQGPLHPASPNGSPEAPIGYAGGEPQQGAQSGSGAPSGPGMAPPLPGAGVPPMPQAPMGIAGPPPEGPPPLPPSGITVAPLGPNPLLGTPSVPPAHVPGEPPLQGSLPGGPPAHGGPIPGAAPQPHGDVPPPMTESPVSHTPPPPIPSQPPFPMTAPRSAAEQAPPETVPPRMNGPAGNGPPADPSDGASLQRMSPDDPTRPPAQPASPGPARPQGPGQAQSGPPPLPRPPPRRQVIPQRTVQSPDLSRLPPAIAESIARLAGQRRPPPKPEIE